MVYKERKKKRELQTRSKRLKRKEKKMSSGPQSALFRRSAAAASDTLHNSSNNNSDTARMEQENNALMRALLDDVRGLKTASGRIRTEVQSHNVLLNALLNTTESAKRGLTSTMKKLDGIGGWSSNAHMWLLFVFMFAVCCFIVVLLKSR